MLPSTTTRRRLGLLLLLTLMGCKNGEDPADTSEGSQDARSLACDCSTLVPVSARPDFPRVAKQGDYGGRCEYLPAATVSTTRVLQVIVAGIGDEADFDSRVAKLTGMFVRNDAAPTRTLADSGRLHFAIGRSSQNSVLWAVYSSPTVGFVFEIREDLEQGEAEGGPPTSPPDVVSVLSSTAHAACYGE